MSDKKTMKDLLEQVADNTPRVPTGVRRYDANKAREDLTGSNTPNQMAQKALRDQERTKSLSGQQRFRPAPLSNEPPLPSMARDQKTMPNMGTGSDMTKFLGSNVVKGTPATMRPTVGIQPKDMTFSSDRNVPLPPKRPADLNITRPTPAAPTPKPVVPAPDIHSKSKAMFQTSQDTGDSAASFFAADAQRQKELGKKTPNDFSSESGPIKGKKKMSENTLINAFLKLQSKNHSNIFEAAKKAKKDYDKDGKIESEKDEVWGSRMRAAKAAGKMEEATSSDPDFAAPRSDGTKKKEDIQYKPSTKTQPSSPVTAPMPPKRPKMDEEFDLFSEEELAYFEAVIANKDQKQKARGTGDVVDDASLTDEYIDEMAKRGRKPGVKVGSYKKKGMDDSERDEHQAETKRVAAQAKTTRSHFDDSGKEVVGLTHPTTKKTYNVGIRHVNDFHRAYQTAEKPADKERVEGDFIKKHMSS
ncbi:hypothetical protein UFOVP787_26 [uncultured Caudovirales phage]|uniref:Uncharacterized protein n=1 Tax=uncultured Caudovirales phage TaxID=2100421 RepID=A0A6J5P456_9CAUD|nr:hypothetical protein UFOVP787_26 [uncultured Caudovirales phage]